MLSDEEKKALKELTEIKELVEEDLKYKDYEVAATLDQIDLESLVIVLNLIEKQFKEIEEFKNADLTTVYLNGFYDGEKKEYEELKSLLYTGTISQYGKRKLIDIIEKQSKEIEELKDMNERQKYRIELVSENKIEERGDSIDESTMLKQIKSKLDEKNIPIETLLAEFERLEDLEDDLTTVYLNGVYDGEKKVKDKIKAKIEEVKDGTFDAKIVLQSLLEKE